MKKLIYYALLMSTVLCMGLNVSAQSPCGNQPPCIPDCPNDSFSSYQNIDVAIAPNCTLRVTYAYRAACFGKNYDYYISNVQILVSTGCPFPISDARAVMEAATMGLLEQNPANFPPSTPGCTINWRVGKGACWDRIGDCFVPCLPVACCVNGYRVCIDASGNKTITFRNTIGPPPGGCTTGPSGLTCVDICN